MGHLLVPITVEAFAANRHNEKEKWISDVMPDFTALSDTILGDNLQKPPFSLQKPLESGVHVHFILPDALTHGTEEECDFRYPDIPDRWLVVRIWKKPQEPAFELAAWMVESDYVGMEETAVPVPALQDREQPYRYMGRSYRLDEEPEEGEYLGGLTVFGPGDPAFAAYYPNCRGVLGFHDPLEDVPCGVLSYFVAGWYGSGSDPLAQLDVKAWQSKLEEFSWKVSGMPETDDEGHVRSRILCHGTVCGVEWRGPEASYDDGRPKGHVAVTVGDTSVEALSALMASRLEGEDPQDMEFLLNALQYGCLELADEIDGRQKIADIIHDARFSDDRAGKQWELAADKEAVLTDESRLLHGDLVKLQEESDRWGRKYDSLRQRLYDVWHSYFLLYEDPFFTPKGSPSREALYSLFQSLCSELESERKRGAGLSAKREAAERKLRSALSQHDRDYHMENVPAAGYRQSAAPVLLFSGEGLQRGFVYGEDGRFDRDNKLVCRLSDEIVQSLDVQVRTSSGAEKAVVIGRRELLSYCTGMSLPEDMQSLVCESMLLDISSAGTLAAVAYRLSGIVCGEKELEELAGQIRQMQTIPWSGLICGESGDGKQSVRELAAQCGFRGVFPSKAAVNFYEPSMNTLFLEWKVMFYPTKTGGQEDHAMEGWAFHDRDYEYDGAVLDTPAMFMGRTVVTPHSQRIFQAALQKQAKQCEDITLRKKLEQAGKLLEELCLLSQSLDGFQENLTGRQPGPGFPYMITSADLSEDQRAAAMTLAVKKYLQEFSAVPAMDSDRFFPIRAGLLKIQEVQLVGSFGQRQTITADFDTISGTSAMRPPAGVKADAVLRPRISQGGRVSAEWMPAKETAPSPVCGYVIPDRLNHGLMVYDAEGIRLGDLQLVWRDDKSFCRWHPAPSADGREITDVDSIPNADLKGLAVALLHTEEGVFAGFLQSIEERQDKTLPEDASHNGEESLLGGRPMALVRAGVSLSLKGLPEYRKSMGNIGDFDSGRFEDTWFDVAVGDPSRCHEGCVRCFAGTDGKIMYDAGYDCGRTLQVRHDGVPVQMALLVEPASPVTFYTGAYPAIQLRLPEEFYKDAYSRMYKSTALYPLLGAAEGVRLPVSEAACESWSLLCPQTEGGYTQAPILPDLPAFSEERLWILDGQLAERQGEENEQEQNADLSADP